MGETCFARLACGHARICLAGLTRVSFSPLVPLTGSRNLVDFFLTVVGKLGSMERSLRERYVFSVNRWCM